MRIFRAGQAAANWSVSGMISPLFIVVEDRKNNALRLCCRSAEIAGERLFVLADSEAGLDYKEFCEAYVHLSSNSSEFEKVCFRRYFLLAAYLCAHPECDRFILIDSDVLLFRGAGVHIAQLASDADFCGSFIESMDGWNPRQISPHVSCWTAAGLHQFVAYVLEMYRTAAGRHKLREIAESFETRGMRGGVSDMTLLYLWAHETGNDAPINRRFAGKVIDHNINSPHNHQAHEFMTCGGAKRLAYVDGQPFLRTQSGAVVGAVALHFQGSAKLAMSCALRRQVRIMALITFGVMKARKSKDWVFKLSTLARRIFSRGEDTPA